MKQVFRFCVIAFIMAALILASASAETYTFIEGSNGTKDVEGPQCLVDGNVSTKWCRKMNGECYIIFKAQKPISINGYMLIKANDDEKFPARTPLQWTFYGANAKSAPKKTDKKAWQVIDKHDPQRDASMGDSGNWNSYAFIQKETVPEYEYFMLVINSTLGDKYMQLSELRLISGNAVDVPIIVKENAEKAVVAMGELQYDDAVFSKPSSGGVASNKLILSGKLLNPIKKADEVTIRLKLKKGEEWPKSTNVSVKILSAYDINEASVKKPKYAQLYINSK